MSTFPASLYHSPRLGRKLGICSRKTVSHYTRHNPPGTSGNDSGHHSTVELSRGTCLCNWKMLLSCPPGEVLASSSPLLLPLQPSFRKSQSGKQKGNRYKSRKTLGKLKQSPCLNGVGVGEPYFLPLPPISAS